MRKTLATKIICTTVAILFLINDLAYGLSTMPLSSRPEDHGPVYALGQKLFAAKRVGPGSRITEDVDNIIVPKFSGKTPKADGVTNFRKADYNNPPAEWSLNKTNRELLKNKDLISALRCFRKNEAEISGNFVSIEEGYFEVDEAKGELPIARIETLANGKYKLVVHTKFVQMWNDLIKNDIWFDYNFFDGETRTVSVAWAMFYRLAKHEMMNRVKGDWQEDGGGHLYSSFYGAPAEMIDDEFFVNQIGGLYNIVNDAAWMWFLGSYCFKNTTRYNNNTLKSRLRWFFNGKTARRLHLNEEFPNLLGAQNKTERDFAINLALNINKAYFSVKGRRVPKFTVDQKFIDAYKRRAPKIVETTSATGSDADKDPRTEDERFAQAKAAKHQPHDDNWSGGMSEYDIGQLVKKGDVTELVKPGLWNQSDTIRAAIISEGNVVLIEQYIKEFQKAIRRAIEENSDVNITPQQAVSWLAPLNLPTSDDLYDSFREIFLRNPNELKEFEKLLEERMPQSKTGREEVAQPTAETPKAELAEPISTIATVENGLDNQSGVEVGGFTPFMRYKDESVIMGNNITIEVLEVKNDRVRFGITAPKGMDIMRAELGVPLNSLSSMQSSECVTRVIARKPSKDQDEIWIGSNILLRLTDIRILSGGNKAMFSLRVPSGISIRRGEIYFSPASGNTGTESIGYQSSAAKETPFSAESKPVGMSSRMTSFLSDGRLDELSFEQEDNETALELVRKQMDTAEFWQTRSAAIDQTKNEPVIKAIDFKVQIAPNDGPGAVALTRPEILNVWQIVNLIHENRIKIVQAQEAGLSSDMATALRDIRKREGKPIIDCSLYSDETGLENLLGQRTDDGTLWIVLTADKRSQEAVKNLVDRKPELFASIRTLNMELPKGYENLGYDSKEKTFYQANMILRGALARLYEKDNPIVDLIIRSVFDGCVSDMSAFLNGLVESKEEASNPEMIKQRVKACLDRIVSLVALLGEKMEHLRLIMKEFWTAA